ncbi:LacI family DNA-binding transcriptional regulator [Metabacillus litoralis]|uniref:LacI family DNA-binding transcriptional regulator n=1 Tax=Metabacillus litoralis TaxID=152268 RepID=UPI001CFDF6E2|nr:LacI family DNA-binding transcriptional regulator [Metabacillus litoralis]
MAKKITMQHIADYLGVSKFVVSKALSGKEGVSATTRDKVLDAASKLGYFTQENAKEESLSLQHHEVKANTKNNNVVLVLMPNIRFQSKTSNYWGRILDGIRENLEKYFSGVVVLTENNIDSLENILNPRGFVGVISIGVVSTALLLEVKQLNIPIVMVDYEEPSIRCDVLYNNSFDHSYQLTNYLIGLGHEKLQFIGDKNYSRSFQDRWLGFRHAMELNNLEVAKNQVVHSTDDKQLIIEIQSWLSIQTEQSMPTAIVCCNDNMALRVISEVKATGLKVPEDVSVTGFDNMDYSYTTTPTITTVNIAKKDLGIRAVEMLVRRLKDKEKPFEKVLLNGSILLRDSTTKPKK